MIKTFFKDKPHTAHCNEFKHTAVSNPPFCFLCAPPAQNERMTIVKFSENLALVADLRETQNLTERQQEVLSLALQQAPLSSASQTQRSCGVNAEDRPIWAAGGPDTELQTPQNTD